MNRKEELVTAIAEKSVKVMLVLILFNLLTFPLLSVQAEEIANPLGPGATIARIIGSLIRFAKTLLAPLAVLMVLIAGFLYMTGGGSEEKIKTAHRVFLWAVVGIAIVLIAESVCAIVGRIIGAACE